MRSEWMDEAVIEELGGCSGLHSPVTHVKRVLLVEDDPTRLSTTAISLRNATSFS